jgi:hypothetical protein
MLLSEFQLSKPAARGDVPSNPSVIETKSFWMPVVPMSTVLAIPLAQKESSGTLSPGSGW